MDKSKNIEQLVGETINDWKVSSSPDQKILIGNHCKLEPIDLDKHSLELYQSLVAKSHVQNWTYLPYGPFANYEDFLAWMKSACLGKDPFFYSVIDIKSKKPVGLASYLNIMPETGVIEVGHIHYSAQLQKTVAATETMYIMIKHAFDKMGYRRYEWKCDSLNKNSRKAALRLGFSFEGIFRNATMYKGRNRDTSWYSIIDSEWPPVKIAFNNWLSPNNFDLSGNQIKSLFEFQNLQSR